MENDKTDNMIPNSDISENNSENNGDEFVIGNGFVIDSESVNNMQPDNKRKKKKEKKPRSKKGIIKTIIWIVLILVISAVISIGGIYAVIDYMGLGASNTVTMTIEKGETLDDIADELEANGVIRFKFLFKFYADKKGYYEKFSPGVHTVRTDMGYSGIVNNFATVEGYSVKTVAVTIPRTATIDNIAKLLEKKGVCSKEEFYDAEENSKFNYSFIKNIPTNNVHYRLEGYLYPDTYEFYQWNSKDGAEFAINTMLKNFDTKFSAEYRTEAEKNGYSLHETLTMASIIELECNGYDKEMPKVSAVFYNRLHAWGDQPKMLGSSPTADYPYGSGNYDTNKIEGLPPGPLCSPSEAAIKASVYPNKSFHKKYYYFVTDSDFKYYYNETLDSHNATISSLMAQGKWEE